METHPSVRIIIPVYNEERILEQSLRTLCAFLAESRFPYPYRITIIDNGSTDGTEHIARALSLPSVEYERISEKGKGCAIREGWKAPGEVLAFMDVDLASDLHSFRPLIDVIASGAYDVSIGNRLGRTSRIEGRRFVRGLASRLYNLMVRVTFMTGLDDHQCGFKAIRRDVYQAIAPRLRADGWFFDTELLVRVHDAGYRIHSEELFWRDDRVSKVSLLNTSVEMFRALYVFKRSLLAEHRATPHPPSEVKPLAPLASRSNPPH